jgi:uncharacterized heparinase superfamily protein
MFFAFTPSVDLSSAPAIRPKLGLWIKSIRKEKSLCDHKTFYFFGQFGSIDQVGWDAPVRDKLWRYNQHYFNDLNAAFSLERHRWHLSILEAWTLQNPPLSGVGWDPYPTSLRIVNWIKWVLNGSELPSECVHSLAVQARFLSRRIEWHLLGNHLLANAKALIFAGLFFDGNEADSWLRKGFNILRLELQEQILHDGGYFERSTMYHAIVLEDFLDLLNIAQLYSERFDVEVMVSLKSIVIKMLYWLECMTHPDGQISFFNDAALSIAPPYATLLDYALSIGIQVERRIKYDYLNIVQFNDSGYIRISSNEAVAFLDVAPIGPDYLPAHAHADTLSFEFSLHGQRIIVNGGTSCYGLGPKRLSERKTRAHSTVEILGESSSEVWAGFRVARRANPFGLEVSSTKNLISVACSHDGYTRLHGKPIHRRTWNISDRCFSISDNVSFNAYSVARFILHPHVKLEKVNLTDWRILLPSGAEVVIQIKNGNGFQEAAHYAPEFGVIMDTQCLAVELDRGHSLVNFLWLK